jgi:hypothetical protein
MVELKSAMSFTSKSAASGDDSDDSDSEGGGGTREWFTAGVGRQQESEAREEEDPLANMKANAGGDNFPVSFRFYC